MAMNQAFVRASRGLCCGALWLTACQGKQTTPAIEAPQGVVVEGDVDDGERYSHAPDLGRPPSLEALAVGGRYLESVATLLQPAWSSFLSDCAMRLPGKHPFNESELIVALDLGLSLEGQLLGVKVETSSGNSEYDDVAVEIVKEQGRFATPPKQWRSDDERVHLLWRFARDKRQAGPATAAMRRITLPVQEAVPVLLASGQVSQAARRIVMAGPGPEVNALLDLVALEALRHAIGTSDPVAASLAIDTATATGARALVGAIRAAAQAGQPHRASALRALGTLGDEQDLELLAGVANGKARSSESAAAAASALVLLNHTDSVAAEAVRRLHDSNDALRWSAIAVLSQVASAKAAPVLVRMIANRKTARGERVAMIAALGRQDATAVVVRALVAGTQARDAAVSAACLQVLGDRADRGLRNKAAYAATIRQLRHKDERVRAAAIGAAARLDPARFAKLLPKLKVTGTDERLSLAANLGEVPGAAALAKLVELSAMADTSVRAAAAAELSKRKEPLAAETLRGLLHDSSETVRTAAVPGLSHEDVTTLLGDVSSAVQAAALYRALLHDREAMQKAVALRFSSTGTRSGHQVLWARAWLTSKR